MTIQQSLADLSSAIDVLEQSLAAVSGSTATFLRDLVAVDLSSQVLIAARATRTLQLSGESEMAYLPARNAFEAACDLLYLLKTSKNPNEAAARAHVGAHVVIRRGLGLLATSGEAIGEPVPDKPPSLRKAIGDEADEIDQLFPGHGFGSLLLSALDSCSQGGDRHWSGLDRVSMIAEIQEEMDTPELGSMLRAYWNALSHRAHPHSRLGDRVHFTGTGIRIDLDSDPNDDAPAAAGTAAATTASMLLRDKLTPKARSATETSGGG